MASGGHCKDLGETQQSEGDTLKEFKFHSFFFEEWESGILTEGQQDFTTSPPEQSLQHRVPTLQV